MFGRAIPYDSKRKKNRSETKEIRKNKNLLKQKSMETLERDVCLIKRYLIPIRNLQPFASVGKKRRQQSRLAECVTLT